VVIEGLQYLLTSQHGAITEHAALLRIGAHNLDLRKREIGQMLQSCPQCLGRAQIAHDKIGNDQHIRLI